MPEYWKDNLFKCTCDIDLPRPVRIFFIEIFKGFAGWHAYLVCPFLERVRSFGIQKLQHGHTNLLQEQDSNLGRRGGKQLPATWTIALLASAYLSHLIILNIIWKAEKRSKPLVQQCLCLFIFRFYKASVFLIFASRNHCSL